MPDTDAARLGLAMAMLSQLVAGHAAGVVHPADWDAARAMVRGWEGGSATGEAPACPSCGSGAIIASASGPYYPFKCVNCKTVFGADGGVPTASETSDLVMPGIPYRKI